MVLKETVFEKKGIASSSSPGLRSRKNKKKKGGGEEKQEEEEEEERVSMSPGPRTSFLSLLTHFFYNLFLSGHLLPASVPAVHDIFF